MFDKVVALAGLIKDSRGVQMSRTFESMVSELPEGRYRVIIEPQTERASIPQRRLLFMWFSYIATHTGMTKKQVHDHYCSRFLTEDMPSTKEMTNLQMTEFMHHIQADAATELGLKLPEPSDGDSYHYFIHEFKDR